MERTWDICKNTISIYLKFKLNWHPLVFFAKSGGPCRRGRRNLESGQEVSAEESGTQLGSPAQGAPSVLPQAGLALESEGGLGFGDGQTLVQI